MIMIRGHVIIAGETQPMGYDSSRVHLIGPFDVAWNTTGIAAGFIAVPGADALPAGTDVVKAWVEVTTAWNSVTTDALSIGISNAALDSHVTLYTADVKTASGATATGYVEPVSTVQKSGTSRVDTAVLSVKVASTGGSLSAGAGKVYALIANADADE